MDYEQKYKEAFKRARNIRFDNPNSATANVVCEEIFPELAESEDEKIRKELITFIKQEANSATLIANRLKFKSMLAWLEKQGEPQTYKGNADTMRKNLIKAFKSVGSNHWGGFDVRDIIHFLESKDAIELERQGEQKPPEWSEEDEKYINDILAILGGGRGYRSNRQIEEWLKSLKPQPHWKPTNEQMQSLYFAVITYSKKNDCKLTYDSLNSLYDDLKKL